MEKKRKRSNDIRGLVISRTRHKCSLYGNELSLTPIEFSILWYLCEHQGKVVPSEELFEAVWKEKYLNNNNTVMAHVGRLREKAEGAGKKSEILSKQSGVWDMKLNKKLKHHLSAALFKSYIISCIIGTGVIFGAALILTNLIFWFLETYVENWYMVYRSLYVWMAAIIIWGIYIVQLTYRLLNKVDGYVDELQEAAEKLFDHNINYIELSPEFGDIAVKINHLKQESENNARLAKESEQKKNDLVMYLAHDLKTPLSSVIGYLILLREEKQISEEMREKYVSISLEKAEQLENLINEFFEITRFNLSNITLQYSRINLTRLLEQLIYEFKPMLKEKNLKCNLMTSDDVMLSCDANKMQRVFENILRNAVIYSYNDTEITVRVDVKEESMEICFENQGNTIPAEVLERIFEQFYRLDSSRGTNRGSGLGLAIAKQIVELHGGTITAQSKDEKIRFMITLPAS